MTDAPVAAPAVQPVELADRVAAAVTAVPGVAGLHPGSFGEVATYLPGRRVTGVRLGGEAAEVHVVLIWGALVLETADLVKAAAGALTGTPVDVTVQDVVLPASDDTAQDGTTQDDTAQDVVLPA